MALKRKELQLKESELKLNQAELVLESVQERPVAIEKPNGRTSFIQIIGKRRYS